MAQAATMKKDISFLWEGRDKKGNRVRGKIVASNRHAVWLDLQRQGIVPGKIKQQSNTFASR